MTQSVPREVFDQLVKVAEYVSLGESMARRPGVAYPDATARFALGALHELGLLTLEEFQ